MKLTTEQKNIIDQHHGVIYIDAQQAGTGLTETLIQKAAYEILQGNKVALLDCNFSARWTNERIVQNYGKDAAFRSVPFDRFVMDHYVKSTENCTPVNNAKLRQLLEEIAQQAKIEPNKLMRHYVHYLDTGAMDGDAVVKRAICTIEALKRKNDYVFVQDTYAAYQEHTMLLQRLADLYDCILIDHFHNAKPHHELFVAALSEKVPLLIFGGNTHQRIVPDNASKKHNVLKQIKPTIKKLSKPFGTSSKLLLFTESLINNAKPRGNLRICHSDAAPLYQSLLYPDDQSQFIATTIYSLLKEGVAASEIAVLSRIKDPLLRLKLCLEEQDIVCNSTFYKHNEYKECTQILETIIRIVRSICLNDDLSISDMKEVLNFCGIDGLLLNSSIERVQQSGLAGICISRSQCTMMYGKEEGRKKSDYLLALHQAINFAINTMPETGVQKLLDAVTPVIRKKYANHNILIGLLSRIKLRYRNLTSWEQTNFKLNNVPPNKEGVALCTNHMALGGRWKHVFMIHVVNGIHPFTKYQSTNELELFYSACTRASQQLYLLRTPYPKLNYVSNGRSNNLVHSQLIKESPFIVDSKKFLTINSEQENIYQQHYNKESSPKKKY